MDNNHGMDLTFPFIPCNYTKHKRLGPQTVVSQFVKDPQKDKLSLFCNTCLRDFEKKYPTIQPIDIEDYVEKFIEKINFTPIELPVAPSGLVQAYEIKDQNVITFRKKMEKEMQILNQTFDEIAQEITKVLFEKRDQMLKAFNNLLDVFSGSYELFSAKYEQMFTWNDKIKYLADLNENKIKHKLSKTQTLDEYADLLNQLNSCYQTLSDLSKAPQKIDDMINFTDCLHMLFQLMPPSPEQRKAMKENVLTVVKGSIKDVFTKISFGKNKVTQKVFIFWSFFIILDHNRTFGIFREREYTLC